MGHLLYELGGNNRLNKYILKAQRFIKDPHFPYLLDNKLKKWLRPGYPYLYRAIRYGKFDINTREYWNEIWKNEGSSSWRDYEKIYSKIIEIIPQRSKVLDVGCGMGVLLNRVKNEKEAKVYGIDISRIAIEKLYQRGLYGQVSMLPFLGLKDETFDVAVGTELLEHLKNPERGIKEICRVVRSNGLMIFTVPDNCMGIKDADDHLHQYNQNTFQEIMKKFGELIFFDSITDTGGPHLVAVINNFKH
jgi:2-polyprenyl-3-methyl-5-hydroxy-6-metoxy-1,4-benzoquinol methylase